MLKALNDAVSFSIFQWCLITDSPKRWLENWQHQLLVGPVLPDLDAPSSWPHQRQQENFECRTSRTSNPPRLQPSFKILLQGGSRTRWSVVNRCQSMSIGPWRWGKYITVHGSGKPQSPKVGWVRPFKQLGHWQLWWPTIHAWKSSNIFKPNLCSWNHLGHSRFGQKSEEAPNCFISANHRFSDETAAAFVRLGTNLCRECRKRGKKMRKSNKAMQSDAKRCKAQTTISMSFSSRDSLSGRNAGITSTATHTRNSPIPQVIRHLVVIGSSPGQRLVAQCDFGRDETRSANSTGWMPLVWKYCAHLEIFEVSVLSYSRHTSLPDQTLDFTQHIQKILSLY